MFTYLLPLADLILVAVLALGLYYPRHRRRDLTLAYLTINIGVLGVAWALGATSVNAGLGLGLFGVLAIIRLRSEELRQHEIAYYFSALALGVIGGLGASMTWIAIALMGGIVATVALADAPRWTKGGRQQVVVLDQAIANETTLRRHLADLLGGRIVGLRVIRLDLVNATTTVEVRFEAGPEAATGDTDEVTAHTAGTSGRPEFALASHDGPGHSGSGAGARDLASGRALMSA